MSNGITCLRLQNSISQVLHILASFGRNITWNWFFVVVDLGEGLLWICFVTCSCCFSTATFSFWPVRVLVSGSFLSCSIPVYIVLSKGSAASFVRFFFKEIEVSRKNRLSSSHSNRMLTNTIMSVPSTGTSHMDSKRSPEHSHSSHLDLLLQISGFLLR